MPVRAPINKQSGHHILAVRSPNDDRLSTRRWWVELPTDEIRCVILFAFECFCSLVVRCLVGHRTMLLYTDASLARTKCDHTLKNCYFCPVPGRFSNWGWVVNRRNCKVSVLFVTIALELSLKKYYFLTILYQYSIIYLMRGRRFERAMVLLYWPVYLPLDSSAMPTVWYCADLKCPDIRILLTYTVYRFIRKIKMTTIMLNLQCVARSFCGGCYRVLMQWI